MSASFARGSRRTNKSTCRSCNRTVIVIEVDGGKVECDPEFLNVIPIDGPPMFQLARRAHADLCEKYKREAELLKLRAEAKAFANGAGLKRPKPGRREPGQ